MADYHDYGYSTGEASHAFNYLKEPLLNMLKESKKGTILDLGCGNGFIANYLLQQGFDVYGLDASAQGIAIADKINPGRFFVQDLSTGDLPAGLKNLKFSTIISTEVIEHLYDPAAFANFCRSLLQPGGEIIISTPYHGYLKNLSLSLFNKWDQHINPLWLGGHIKLWSAATVNQLLTNAGFKVTAFAGSGRVPYFWKSMIIKAQAV